MCKNTLTVFTYSNLTNTDLGIPSDSLYDPERQKIIDHIRGIDAYDINQNLNSTEERNWKLGDIFHSNAVIVGLERVNQLQADFTAMIAHDLRSPLMNISGAAEVMINGMFGDVDEEQKRWLAKILANSHSLVNLVSDFLDVAKLEAGYVELSREPMDLRKLMDTSLDNFLILAQKNGIA